MPAADLSLSTVPASGSLGEASGSADVSGQSQPLIRRAVDSDAAALHALARSTFPLACPPGTPAAEIERHIAGELSTERFAQFLADPARTLIVAEIGSELIGYTMLVHEEPTDAEVAGCLTARPTVELSKCYLARDHHATGVAARLLQSTIAAARDAGAAAIWLGANEHNDRANRFYNKHGFRVIGHKLFYVGSDLNDDFVRELVL